MNKTLKIILYILLIPVGLIVLLYGGFGLSLLALDQASYHGNDLYIGPIDYDSVLAKAEDSGYDIGGDAKSNLIEPGNVEALEERFKDGYMVHRVGLYYNKYTYLEFCKYDSQETAVTLWNHSEIPTSLETSKLPADSWMLEMLGRSLWLNETGSREFLEKLKLEGAQQWTKRKCRFSGNLCLPESEQYENCC